MLSEKPENLSHISCDTLDPHLERKLYTRVDSPFGRVVGMLS